MIAYDRTHIVPLIFAFRGTIWPRVLPQMIAFTVVTTLLWLLDRHFGLVPRLDPLGHTLMGVTVGMLIVFRNNCSYDRFWEGRRLWGAIVGQSRIILRTATAFMTAPTDELATLVVAYAHELKDALRGSRTVRTADPTLLAWQMSDWINTQYVAGKLDVATARALDNAVSSLMESQTGCERIQTTPLPFAYAVHLKQMLCFYLLTLPFVVLAPMGAAAIPAVAIIAFGLLGVEKVGVEIEDPFGSEANDLAIEAFCQQIAQDANAMTALASARSAGAERRAA